MNEVGKELKVSELVPKTVVVVRPPEYDIYVTMWIQSVSDQTVVFYSGELRWSVINFVKTDGTLVDDQDRKVQVFEYLGKI